MVDLNQFVPCRREELLKLLSAAVCLAETAGADSAAIRGRIHAERLLLNLRRARRRLETWAATTGGAWEVTTEHEDDRWHAHLLVSYNGNLQKTTRAADTELAALEAALWDARFPHAPPNVSIITTVAVAALTAIMFVVATFAFLWAAFE